MSKAAELKQRWIVFASVLLDPLVFVLIGVCVALLIFSLNQTNSTIIALFTVLLSIATGLLGGAASKKWDDLTQEKLIIARGTTAVRSLNLLLSHVDRLYRKSREYLKICESEQDDGVSLNAAKIYLSVVADISVGLLEEVLGSIENWTDIVPDASVETQIDIMSKLTEELATHEIELKEVNERVKASVDGSQEQIKALKAEKSQIEKELKRVRRDHQLKQYEFRPTLSSASSIITSDSESYAKLGDTMSFTTQYLNCPHCDYWGPISEEDKGICPSCGKKAYPSIQKIE